jgi:glycosyltransferase involved in cell wall biosynthesis
MIGSQAGKVTSQGLIVAGLLRREGYCVTTVSHASNRYVRLLDMIQTLLRRGPEFDVVILEVYGGRSLVVEEVTSRLCACRRIPLVMVLHGGNLPVFARRFPNSMRLLLKRADALIAPSKYLRDAMRPYGGENIAIIPNSLFEEDYPFRPRTHVEPRVLWMRSFHDVYNPEMALYVIAKLKTRYPTITLAMGGMDMGRLEHCQRLARDLQLEQHVCFPGFLNLQRKQQEANRADIFLNTSRVDNMPVALLEAAAFGLPVVTTDPGGIPALFRHGENAFLVPNGAVDDMATHIDRLIQSPALAAKLSYGGRALAEGCFWSAVKPLWDQLLMDLTNRNQKQDIDGCAAFVV